MRSLALILGVGLALSGLDLAARQSVGSRQPGIQSRPPLDLVHEWMAAARAHQFGTADPSALQIAAWPRTLVTAALMNVNEIAVVLMNTNARDQKAGHEQAFICPMVICGHRSFTRAQFLRFLNLPAGDPFAAHPAELLERGAMLHADIAMLIDAPAPPLVEAGRLDVQRRTTMSILTSDGVVQPTQDNFWHWGSARLLLDTVLRDTSSDNHPWVEQWYRATSAWQMNEMRWSVADQHLTRARQLFPDDGRMWFYSGVVHEVMAGPVIQTAMDASAKLGMFFRINGESKELEQAAIWLRTGADLDPAFGQGHLHLGRVLGGLGHHDDAARELRQASVELADREQNYYARLFLGYELGMLGDHDGATSEFEQAAQAYPMAQSPFLGMSQIARRFDDVPAAKAALDRLLALPIDGRPDDDPWWDYMRAHVRDAGVLMDDVRRSLVLRGPQ